MIGFLIATLFMLFFELRIFIKERIYRQGKTTRQNKNGETKSTMNATKIISVLIGGVLGAICAGITAFLLGNPFASAAVGFVWCFAGYYIGKCIGKAREKSKGEKSKSN